MKRNSAYSWIAILASFGLVTAACTADDEPDTSNEATDSAPSRTALEVVTVEPPNLVPFDGHGGKVHISNALFMPLLWVDDENELYSDILDSWETSEDGGTVTLTLQPDLEWSDGTPISSADLVMSLTHHLDSRVSTRSGSLEGVTGVDAYVAGEAEEISGLSAVDELTVSVELDGPSPWVRQLASHGVVVLPEHVLGEVAPGELEEHEYFETFPVTNGPYMFSEWASGQHVELERNDNWSLGEPGFERVFFKFLAPDVQAAQLQTGEVQYIWRVDPAEADRLGAQDGLEVEAATGAWPATWSFMHHGPLEDPRVRQAMAYAIDREGICEEVLLGYCTVQNTNIPQIAPEWAIPTDDVTEYTYDPDRARQLLDEAGWDPSTELVFLDWLEPGSSHKRALTIAQDNMADVGINWTIENVDLGALNERSEQDPTSFNGYPNAGGNFTVDPSFPAALYSCDGFYPEGANRGRYCNEELDETFDAGYVETDQDRRAEIYQDAFRVVNEEVPEIYLHVLDEVVAFDSCLDPVGSTHPSGAAHYQKIGEWTWNC